MNVALSRYVGELFLAGNATPEERATVIDAVNSDAGAAATDWRQLPPAAVQVIGRLRERAGTVRG